MQFLNPIWLWGFAGILVPIGIHLLSRKQGRTIKIGSVRHLEDTHTKQFKSLRINEILLLLLRCLIITTLVFLLSELHIHGIKKKGIKWVLIEKGLERDAQFTPLIDSLRQDNFILKELAPGFPDFTGRIEREPINYWALMDEIKKEPLDQVIVLSYSYAVGFKGLRGHIPNNVNWISKNSNAVDFPVQAVRISKDSVSLRTGKSNAYGTAFFTRQVSADASRRYLKSAPHDSVMIGVPDTMSIAVLSDPEFNYEKRIMLAALTVLKTSGPHILNIDTTRENVATNKNINWIVWLSRKRVPAFSKHTIIYQGGGDFTDLTLFQRNAAIDGNYYSWILTKRLDEEIAVQHNLTAQLALILFPGDRHEALAQTFDRRALPENIAWDAQPMPALEIGKAQTISAEKFLVVLFFTILILERFLAFKRNQ